MAGFLTTHVLDTWPGPNLCFWMRFPFGLEWPSRTTITYRFCCRLTGIRPIAGRDDQPIGHWCGAGLGRTTF